MEVEKLKVLMNDCKVKQKRLSEERDTNQRFSEESDEILFLTDNSDGDGGTDTSKSFKH